MTNAERQARHRAARAAARPVIRYRRSADHRSRAQRWRDPIALLIALQAEYRTWLAALPDNLQDSAPLKSCRPSTNPRRCASCAGDCCQREGDDAGNRLAVRVDAEPIEISPLQLIGASRSSWVTPPVRRLIRRTRSPSATRAMCLADKTRSRAGLQTRSGRS